MAATNDIDRAVTGFRSLAQSCGEVDPKVIGYVLCTLGEAQPNVNHSPERAQEPSIVVMGSGTFMPLRMSKHALPRTRRYLEVTMTLVDAAVWGYGMSDREPDIAALGPIHRV